MSAPLPNVNIPIEQQPLDILLAMLVWGEARGEPESGRIAVAHVAMNRAKRKYGGDLKKAILQPYAFSCFNKLDIASRYRLLRPTMFDKLGVWQACYEAASEVRNGLCQDPTSGAVCYCTRALWARPRRGFTVKWFELPEVAARRTRKLIVIGNHVFADTKI